MAKKRKSVYQLKVEKLKKDKAAIYIEIEKASADPEVKAYYVREAEEWDDVYIEII